MSARRRSSNISRNDTVGQSCDDGGQQPQQEEDVTNIKVAVRCRPFSTNERSRGERSCFRIENGAACLENPSNPNDVYRFGFDLIYGGDSEQLSLWRDVGVPAMEKAFAGFNTTIFAYGQTGSGKTFSMQGVGGGSGEGAGIIPRMNEELFARVTREREADANKMFLVTCSYFEIYNEVVYDLLDPNNRKRKGAGLEIREHGVLGIYVKGLQEMVVTSPDSMQRLIDQGMASRTVGSTAMNDTSSRSHSVFTVKVHQKDSTDESKSTFAKINLVDLAGSERAKSTGATGARLKEGANINKSLSSLGNVINALVDVANGKKGVFVPYRNSKLTRVLQESLGGNSLTAMLAALSPAACNFEESLSTLKYASRAKSIKVNAVKNEEASQVSRLEEEIRALKQKLQAQQQQQQQQATSSTFSTSSPSTSTAGNAATAVTPGGERGDVGGAEAGDSLAGGRGGDGSDHGGGGGDRYKQQIAEMEAAMRSTWEEKAKQSESSERERQRLQQQLAEEARREERERKKRWRALEDKGDLELSIREAKEVALPTLPARDWLGQVRALAAAEHRAKEEATVCAVYREALARELEGVFSGDRVLTGSSSHSGHYGGGDLEDDRASVASTACTASSETESIAVAVADDGDGRHRREGTGGGAADGGGGLGSALIRRGIKFTSSYDPVLLRQLQARLTSLTDARERLHGLLAEAVQRGSKQLLESVDSFAEKFAASPHDHVERGPRDGNGSRRRGDGTEAAGREDNATEAAAERGGGEEMGKAAARKKRWEARKNEGTRALALIRRQVIARGRTKRRQRRSCNVVGGNSEAEAILNPAGQPPSAAAAAAAAAAAPVAPTSVADVDSTVTSKAADCAALCPAAEIIASAVEAVLNGSTATFGGPATAAAGMVAVVGVSSERSEAVDAGTEIVEGAGEESLAERKRYRDILQRLGGAHGVLREALENATGSPEKSSSVVSSSGGSEAVVSGGGVEAGPAEAGAGSKRRRSRDVRGDSIGEIAQRQESQVAASGGLPPSAQWRVRCSSGGSAEVHGGNDGDGDQDGVGQGSPLLSGNDNDSCSSSNNGESFTWKVPAACEGGGREGEAGGVSGGGTDDKAGASSPVPCGCWVELDFGEIVAVSGLDVKPLQKHRKVTTQQPQRFPQASVSVAGYSIDDVDGSLQKTEAMVGEVMGGWGGILKSTPPAKLLSRPPVRFLYDLFRAVAKATGFGEDEACRSKWEDLSGKKDKIRLMDGMIKKVVDSLALESRPAKGSDIVVGQECAATNTFLQLLALAARADRDSREDDHEQEQQHPRRLFGAGDDSLQQFLGEKAARATVVTSTDGVAWTEADFEVGVVGKASDELDHGVSINSAAVGNSTGSGLCLSLRVAARTALRCRHLRLSWPTAGNDNHDGNNINHGTSNNAGTVRTTSAPDDGNRMAVDINHAAPAFGPGPSVSEHGGRPRLCSDAGETSRGYDLLLVRILGGQGTCKNSGARNGRTKVHPEEEGGETERGQRFVVEDAKGGCRGRDDGDVTAHRRSEAQEQTAMTPLLEAMRSAVGHLLEQSLEWGRIEVANQERRTALRTNKMESLEKRLKASNEAKLRLAKDKKSMAVKAARAEEDNLKLQEQVLRLRADTGRERVENASLTERLAQAETRVEEEKSQMHALEELKRNLECETEDLQNQVEVLTEERDVARSHEEDLFAKLTDRTDDLEALQESYVSLTDRWNDFQDEHDEVLEQLESFRATFKLSSNNHNDNSSSRNNNSTDTAVVSRPTSSGGTTSADPRRDPDSTCEKAPPAERVGCSDLMSQQQGQQQGQQQHHHHHHQRGNAGRAIVGEDGGKVGNGGSTRNSARPTSSSRSSHAPPRPASGRNVLARKTSAGSSASGASPREELRLRLGGGGGENSDAPLKPGSGASPRRPPSLVSSVVPSPRHCSSPRMSGSVGDVSADAASATSAAQEAGGGLRRRRSTQECTGFRECLDGEGGRMDTGKGGGATSGLVHPAVARGHVEGFDSEGDRVQGGNDERRDSQRTRGGDCVEGRNGSHRVNDKNGSSASAPSPTALANPGVLHGGDSGGYYEDDFDDFFEEDSEEGEKRTTAPRHQDAARGASDEVFPTRGGSGEKRERVVLGGCSSSGDGGVGGDSSGTPLTEVVYRPPSGGSRGKGERPKSAARQGRSSSLNGAG